jgi:hypothetical protein
MLCSLHAIVQPAYLVRQGDASALWMSAGHKPAHQRAALESGAKLLSKSRCQITQRNRVHFLTKRNSTLA